MKLIHKCFYPKEYHVSRNMNIKNKITEYFKTWGHNKEFLGLLQVRVYTSCRTWVKSCSKKRWILLKLSIVFVGPCVKNTNLCFLRQSLDNSDSSLELLLVWQLDTALFFENYTKLGFLHKTLRKGIECGVVKFLVPFFQKRNLFGQHQTLP